MSALKNFFLTIAALGALCCVQSANHSRHDLKFAPRAPSHQEMSAQEAHSPQLAQQAQVPLSPQLVADLVPTTALPLPRQFQLNDCLPAWLFQPAVFLMFPSGLSPPARLA